MEHKKIITAMAHIVGITVLGTQVGQAGGAITVSTISDQPQPGLTTLREAIEVTNQVQGALIEFDPVVFSEPQTINLENGELLISSEVTINGPGKDLLTIDGNDQSRVFTINDGTASTQSVQISGLTLTNGNGTSTINNNRGGCVMSNEQLSLIDSKVSGCSADGSDGGAGGGIWSRFGSLLIENSEVTNNYARFRGGGIYARSATAFITSTTISGNTANRESEAGGGINSNGADLIITNSTISNNQVTEGNAGGIFMKSGGELSMVNSTVFNNQGLGIEPSGPVNISNSLIFGHVAGDCEFTNINIDSNNQNNMDSDGSCDVYATNHLAVNNPKLGPLAENGGITMTHLPLTGSPMIDMGNDALCPEFDQRGEARPQDGDADGFNFCDIGAVESLTFEGDFIFNNGFEGE